MGSLCYFPCLFIICQNTAISPVEHSRLYRWESKSHEFALVLSQKLPPSHGPAATPAQGKVSFCKAAFRAGLFFQGNADRLLSVLLSQLL